MSVMTADPTEPTTSSFGSRSANVSLTDSCDRCGYSNSNKGSRIAEPFVQVTLASGSVLVFCKHHANKFSSSIIQAGASVLDWSDEKLNVKASQSSPNA